MTDHEITVKVHSYGDARALSLVYFDPISGRKKAKSSGTTDWKTAERLAGELERELRAGRYAPPSRITWAEFRRRYAEEKLAGMPPKTQMAYAVAFNKLESLLNPDRLCRLTTAAMSDFQKRMRKEGCTPANIAKILRHIKAALRWGHRQGMMHFAPAIEMPKTGAKMKGRPITSEEFERMLAVVPKVRPQDPEPWTRLLTGLWLSGLRLEESAVLSWEYDARFAIDLDGRHPRFRIHGSAQKSGKDELLPLTPDFADWLLANTPEAQRSGPVFPMPSLNTGAPLEPHRIGEIISKIGKKAGVVVATKQKRVKGEQKAVKKFASAHDLRRSFGTRWAAKTKPAVLQRLMRHSNIGTTMGFYVALDADDLAEELWAGHKPTLGNISGNNGPNQGGRPKRILARSLRPIRVYASGRGRS